MIEPALAIGPDDGKDLSEIVAGEGIALEQRPDPPAPAVKDRRVGLIHVLRLQAERPEQQFLAAQ